MFEDGCDQPIGHDWHACVVFRKYVPARQNLHAADACAFSSWYLPAGQEAHGADVFTKEKP